jgi:iron complex transport system substrate-binding protein
MVFQKKLFSLIGAALLALSLTACGGQGTDSSSGSDQASNENEKSAETRTLTDGMGNKVEVPANPKRIIASYLEDHLVALGVKPVAQWSVNDGKTVQDYLQDELKGIPTIPHDLPFEAVQKMNPDLIIMDSASMVEGGKYEQYNQIAPTFVIGEEDNSDWRKELKLIGEVLGKEKEAKKALEEYDAKVAEAKETIKEKVGNPSVAAVWLVGGQFFIVNEKLSSGAVMYGDLGLKVPKVVKEISANSADNWSSISLEKLVELDADYLFLINSDGSNAAPLSDALWKSIPAVKAGNVFEFSPEKSWLYTGSIANSQIIDDILDSLVQK